RSRAVPRERAGRKAGDAGRAVAGRVAAPQRDRRVVLPLLALERSRRVDVRPLLRDAFLMKTCLPFVLVFAACATLPPPPQPATFRWLPGATLSGAAGELRRAAAGRPMVVDFFASWCEPCRASFPRLSLLARSHPEVGVFGVDIGEEPPLVAAFVAREHIDY